MTDDKTDNTPCEPAARNDINELRALLFATIRSVRAGTMELDRARVVNEIGKTITDTGRLEVEHRRVDADAEPTEFMAPAEQHRIGANGAGVLSITRHVLGR